MEVEGWEGLHGLRPKRWGDGSKTERKWLNKREREKQVMDGESDEEGGKHRGRCGSRDDRRGTEMEGERSRGKKDRKRD